MESSFQILPHGDRAVSIIFPPEISPQVNHQVLSLCAALDKSTLPGIVTCVPAYHTLLVEYNPLLLTYDELSAHIRFLSSVRLTENTGRTVSIPVCYGGELGPDLERVAAHNHLTAEEVISRHSQKDYRVYMLGFRPGFPYLGGLDPQISTPRLATPRSRIEAGSVGIAGQQTGIYPEASPGGWNIIGRTPLILFNEKSATTLLHPGDTLRFVPINPITYAKILEKD